VSNSNVAFIYWGKRGGMCRFTLEAARTASAIGGVNACFSISTGNESFHGFRDFASSVFAADTFDTAAGALLKAPQMMLLRRKLLSWLTERNVKLVVVLMPHVWTPLMATAVKRLGMQYAVVFHDGKPHPGDSSGLVFKWLLNDAKMADAVFTLSPWVKQELVNRGAAPAERIKSLFMPDVSYPAPAVAAGRRRKPGQPLRILFFGRLLRYKGLPLFVEAMEILTAIGTPIEISVYGDGDLRQVSARLRKLGAVVVNRWISDDEVGLALATHDVAVLTHIEASQSGTIAAAMGAGLPVVTTPVGGLVDQVRSRGGGLIAARTDARAVADCLRAMADDHALYNRIVGQIGSAGSFSIAHFLSDVVRSAETDPGLSRPRAAAVPTGHMARSLGASGAGRRAANVVERAEVVPER